MPFFQRSSNVRGARSTLGSYIVSKGRSLKAKIQNMFKKASPHDDVAQGAQTSSTPESLHLNHYGVSQQTPTDRTQAAPEDLPNKDVPSVDAASRDPFTNTISSQTLATTNSTTALIPHTQPPPPPPPKDDLSARLSKVEEGLRDASRFANEAMASSLLAFIQKTSSATRSTTMEMCDHEIRLQQSAGWTSVFYNNITDLRQQIDNLKVENYYLRQDSRIAMGFVSLLSMEIQRLQGNADPTPIDYDRYRIPYTPPPPPPAPAATTTENTAPASISEVPADGPDASSQQSVPPSS
ncbi:hypothetical protein BC829DRAFT_422542 [Chytridium lagenaria]|nr:hypothetical protein BC829DRAFT_422542 [Chytridium lagenaria]